MGEWNEALAAYAGQLKDLVGDALVSAIAQFPNFEHLEAAGTAKGHGAALRNAVEGGTDSST